MNLESAKLLQESDSTMNKQYDIIILTDSRYVNFKKIDAYTQNVMDEDSLVKTALKNNGLKVERISWDTKEFD